MIDKNKNICIMPWIAIDRNRNNDTGKTSLTPCCIYEPKTQSTNTETYWNSDEMISLRQQLLDGKRPDGCRICWKNEDNGNESLRQSINDGRLELYQDRLKKTKLDVAPAQVKYTVGIECNLACRMCLPNFSSKVKKVWDILGKEYDMELDNILNDADYILKNRKNIHYLDIQGGEPFYHKKAKNLLKKLIETKDNEHITLYITTNATRIDPETVNLLKQFKDAVLSISVDSVGKIQEYIRPGCNWELLSNNIKTLKENNISLQVVSTISVLTILNLHELEQWCNDNDIHFAHPGLVEIPHELAPHNLPYQLHEFVPEKYKKFILKKPTHDPVNFIKTLDTYWKTNIVDVIPQWKKVFDNLHWKQQQELQKLNDVAKKYAG